MATDAQLMAALRAADAAGNVEDATALARAIQSRRQAAKPVMNVRLPNGTIISGVPEGTSRDEVRRRAIRAGIAEAKDFNVPGKAEGTAAAATQGLTLGFADEIGAAVAAPFAAMQTGNSLGDAYRGVRDAARARSDAFSEANPGTALAAEIGGGLLTGAVGGGRALANTAGRQMLGRAGAIGAGMGAASGTGYSDAASTEGLLDDAASGAVVGGLLGAGLPAVGQQISRVRQAAMTGRASDPYRQSVARLEGAGVPLTSGQATGANWVKTLESTLPDVPLGGKPLQALQDRQRQAYQRNLWQMVGLADDEIADDAMLTARNLERARDKLSQEYAEALGGRSIDLADDAFLDALGDIEGRNSAFVDSPTAARVRSVVEQFLEEAQKGARSGEWYQQQRSIFARRAKGTGELAPLYQDLKQALDGAFARAAGGNVKGDLDTRWRRFKLLEEYFNKGRGGPEGAEGFISPGQLLRMDGRGASVRPDEFSTYLRDAQSVLPSRLGNSGTAQRNMTMRLLTGGGLGLLDPMALIYGPAIARAASGAVAGGRRLDLPAMLPDGGLLAGPGGVAPSATAGLLVSDR